MSLRLQVRDDINVSAIQIIPSSRRYAIVCVLPYSAVSGLQCTLVEYVGFTVALNGVSQFVGALAAPARVQLQGVSALSGVLVNPATVTPFSAVSGLQCTLSGGGLSVALGGDSQFAAALAAPVGAQLQGASAFSVALTDVITEIDSATSAFSAAAVSPISVAFGATSGFTVSDVDVAQIAFTAASALAPALVAPFSVSMSSTSAFAVDASTVPDKTITTRAGSYLVDRSGNYIVTR